jgi:hypothetical protein
VSLRVTAGRPQGGSLFVYALVRRTGNNEYRPKLVLNPNGSVAVHAGLVQNGSESAMGSQVVVPGLVQSVGSFIWLRAQVTGANPTTVRVKAWADGTTEPATWAYSATNSVAAVQGAGSVGLRTYANSTVTNAPLTVSFDDLTVESLDSPPAPVADFSWSQTPDPLTYSFTDESTGGPSEWLWEFGDGDTSTEQNPTHPYLAEGTYTVTLTATNAVDSDSITQDVDVQAAPPGPTVVASDSFLRTKADSWGVADAGGLYSYSGRLIDFDVNGSQGALHLPSAGQTRNVFLLDVLAHDTEMSFSISPTKVAAGSSFYVYSVLRRTTDGSAYRPKVRFAPGGQVFVHAGRLMPSGETSLGPEVRVTGLSYAANSVIWLRARVTGSNPTTIQVRAWADGQPEPGTWQFTATDSTAALQPAGAVGVASHLASGSTIAPLLVRIDDLLVTTSDPVNRVQGETLVGAGDIAVCNGNADEGTAVLLDQISGTVFTAGDNAYPDANAHDFNSCYDPTWGRHKARTYPTVGNHEYRASSTAGPYFDYFGAVAGERGMGWYAYDVGTWRVYVLNSNCGFVSCALNSEQLQWATADMAANPRTCSIAIWHAPRYSSGSEHGSTTSVQPFWQTMANAGVELVLSGHDHDYERFAPMNGAGALDTASGMRQFVVGTGGTSLRAMFPSPIASSEVRQASSNGVLKLTLGASAYEWEFIPIAGQAFTDRGSGSCH